METFHPISGECSVDDWQEYMEFVCKQMERKYRHTYPMMNGKMPLLEWAGIDGIDHIVKIPKSYKEWKSLYK